MRARHVAGVVAVLIIGLAVKQFFFVPTKAEADIPSVRMDVMQMHVHHPNMKGIQVQKIHDMETVFADGD
jgi:hypothetical protein